VRYMQGRITRYLGAMVLAFGLLTMPFVPAALAMTNEHGNAVLPQVHNNTGPTCYVDGAVQSCDGPVPVNMSQPSQVGTTAGAGTSTVLQDINGAGNH
jgi:hypothetical protein